MSDLTLTRHGEVFGSLAWMPPEQALGEWPQVDALSDVYALGAILFFLVSGGPVIAAGLPVAAQLAAAQSGGHPPLRERAPDVPRDLAAIADQCLQREKAQRYQSVAALEEDVTRWQAGEPVMARRGAALYWLGRKIRRHWKPAAALAAGIAMAGTAAWERRRLELEREAAVQALVKRDAEQANQAKQALNGAHEMMSQFLVESRQRFTAAGHPEWADTFEARAVAFPWAIGETAAPFDPRRAQGRLALVRADTLNDRGDYLGALRPYREAVTQLAALTAEFPETAIYRRELSAARRGEAEALIRTGHPREGGAAARQAAGLLLPERGPAERDNLPGLIDVCSLLAFGGIDDPASAAGALETIERVRAATPRPDPATGPDPGPAILEVRLETARARLLLRKGAPGAAALAIEQGLSSGRRAAETDEQNLLLAQAFTVKAAIAREHREASSEQACLQEASRLIVRDSGRLPRTASLRPYQELLNAWVDCAGRAAAGGQHEKAVTATEAALACGAMLVLSAPENRGQRTAHYHLMLKAAERNHLTGRKEAARKQALRAREQFHRLAADAPARFAENQLGACEAALLLLEWGATPEPGESPWADIVLRELQTLDRPGPPLTAGQQGVRSRLLARWGLVRCGGIPDLTARDLPSR